MFQSADIKWIVLFSGLVISFVWVLIQRRTLGHLKYLEQVVQKLEEALKIPADHALSGWINKALYEKLMPHPKWLRAPISWWDRAAWRPSSGRRVLVMKALHWV